MDNVNFTLTLKREAIMKTKPKNKWTKEEMRFAKIRLIAERQDTIDYLLTKIKPKPLPQEFFILEKEYKNFGLY